MSSLEIEEGFFLYEQGIELVKQKNFQEAIPLLKRALDIFERLGSSTEIRLCTKILGQVYSQWGKLDEAAGYFEKSLEIQKQIGNEQEFIDSVEKLVAYHLKNQNFEEAINYLKRMQEVFKGLGKQENVVIVLGYLGQVYEKIGNLDQALNHYKNAFDLGKKLDLPSHRLYEKVRDLTNRKRIEGNVALDALLTTQRKDGPIRDKEDDFFEVLSVGGARVKSHTDDYLVGGVEEEREKKIIVEATEKTVTEKRVWVPSVVIPHKELKINVQVVYGRYMELERENVISVVVEEISSELGSDETTVTEKLLGLSLEVLLFAPNLEISEPRRSFGSLTFGELKILQFKVTPKLAGKNYIHLEFYGNGRLIHKAVLTTFVKDALEDVLETRKNIELTPLSDFTSNATLRIQLSQNRFYFHFFTKHADDLTLKGERFGVTELYAPIYEKLQLLMKKITFNGDPQKVAATVNELGKEVYSLIPKSIRNAIKTLNPKYLSMEADDLSIPFELAHDGEDFFCLKYNLGKRVLPDKDYTPPTTIGTGKLRIKLIIARPINETMMRETEFLESLKAKNLITLEGTTEQINKKQLEKILSQESDIIHLYCKIFFNKTEPTEPQLLVGDDMLSIKEIENLKIPNTPLIFTDIHEETHGETGPHRFMGLARIAKAFLNSGASSFIAQLWKIPDNIKLEITTKFYEKIVPKKTPLGAIIREIKNELKQQYSETIWAALSLYGDPALRIIP